MEGNQQKMREALEYVIQWREDCISEEGADNVDAMMAVVNAALSAPERNCDVGTADEQMEKFREFCETEKCMRYRCGSGCKAICIDRCAIAWAQTPYAEEGEGDGN